MARSLGLHAPELGLVRDLRSKKGRRDQQRFAVDGPTLLAEALAAGMRPIAVYATEATAGDAERLAAGAGAPVTVIAERAIERLSDLETPPGIVAVFPLTLDAVDAVLAEPEAAVLLAGIADPGNAGALLRSAEIFGIRHAVFGHTSVEPHNPKVVRAAMGALFRMRVAVADADALLGSVRRFGRTLVAADRSGVPLPAFAFPERAVLAIGNERHGVGAWLPRWDLAVAIPQAGRGESLNAAVAGGIIFYAFSQRFFGKSATPPTSEKP